VAKHPIIRGKRGRRDLRRNCVTIRMHFLNEHLIVVPDMTVAQARQIVQTYGVALGTAGVIADESELPYAKAVIKQAILMVAPFAPSNEVRRTLRQGYLALADFLPGVGEQAIRRLRGSGDGPGNALEAAAFIKDLERRLPWLNRSATEAQQLLRELRDSGFLDD
jgi:hypothetical protein